MFVVRGAFWGVLPELRPVRRAGRAARGVETFPWLRLRRPLGQACQLADQDSCCHGTAGHATARRVALVAAGAVLEQPRSSISFTRLRTMARVCVLVWVSARAKGIKRKCVVTVLKSLLVTHGDIVHVHSARETPANLLLLPTGECLNQDFFARKHLYTTVRNEHKKAATHSGRLDVLRVKVPARQRFI